jgi:N6-adenosine-specific RNA methylase IME4
MSVENGIARVHESPRLVQLADACRLLAEAKSVESVKLLRDQAQAAAHYLRERDYGIQAQHDATEIKIRAERRLGELVRELSPHPGNPQLCHDGTNGKLPAGVSPKESHRWQRMAGVDEDAFEGYIVEVRQTEKPLTTAGVLRLARKPSPAPDEAGCVVDDLHALVAGGKRFGTIYADPPWRYDNQGTRSSTDNHYRTMAFEDLTALPIKGLAADEAHLHLWATVGFVEEALRLIPAWGFEYRSLFVWCKPQMGLGNYWRVSSELLLLGVRGGLTFADRGLMNWAAIDRAGHSEKPEQVRLLIERASPAPRLELFGRRAVPGWTVWGDEIARDLFHQGVAS